MKKLNLAIILLALMLAICSLSHATEVTIGVSNDDPILKQWARPPFNILHGFARSLALYEADQIGTSGIISHLAWDARSSYNAEVPFKIYLHTTTATTLTPLTWQEWLDTNPTLVLNRMTNTHNFNSVGWHRFELDTPFHLPPGQNLLIGIQTDYGYISSPSSAEFYWTDNQDHHLWWDTPNSPPTGNGNLEEKLPNLTITFSDPVLALTPPSHGFGSIAPGTTATQTFSMKNYGTLGMQITSITPTSSGYFSITNAPNFPVSLSSGQTASFNIEYAPEDDTWQEVTFSIAYNGRATKSFTVRGGSKDNTLPVTLSHFSAALNAQNYVLLSWTSQSESNVMGYNLFRNHELELSSAVQVSLLITGTNTSEPHSYNYYDEGLTEPGTYYYWLQCLDLDGTVNFFGPASVAFSLSEEAVNPGVPTVNLFDNAYPNPFNPSTTLRYQIKDPGNVRIDIYNTKGQLVRSFREYRDAAGYYQIIWDGKDRSGKTLPSGVYLCRMNSADFSSTRKVVLAK